MSISVCFKKVWFFWTPEPPVTRLQSLFRKLKLVHLFPGTPLISGLVQVDLFYKRTRSPVLPDHGSDSIERASIEHPERPTTSIQIINARETNVTTSLSCNVGQSHELQHAVNTKCFRMVNLLIYTILMLAISGSVMQYWIWCREIFLRPFHPSFLA